MNKLFAELKRRNVFRVAMAYVVAGWLLAQVAEMGLQNFGAPDWAMKTLLLLLIGGLPVAIILAWAFEVTPDGLRRESELELGHSTTRQSGRKLDLVIIASLAVALTYFVYESRDGSVDDPATVVEKSIAVLPFIRIGGSAEDDYLSDGLAETLLHMLAQIEEIQVAARTSAFKFKNTNEDVRIIGEQLGVATILEGSIQRSGDKIRITAQLINVSNGFHLWSGNFDRTINDIFAVQDEIAMSVVDALQATLLGRIQSEPVRDPAAYEALLRLKEDVRSGNNARLVAAIDSLREMITRHPTYIEAHAALAVAYIEHAGRSGLIPEDIEAKALLAAKDAVRLGPDSAAAHIAMANVLTKKQDFRAAAPVIARALELEPGNAELLVDQAATYTSQFEYNQAVGLLERAMLLDPLNQKTRAALSEAYFETGQNDKAKAILSVALQLVPDNEDLVSAWAERNMMLGNYEEAIAHFRRLGELAPGHMGAWQPLFYAFVDLGDLETAGRYLQKIESLSEDRAADERALYCYVTGDSECRHAATQRMIATRDAFFVKLWQARLLLEQGSLEDAIAVMSPVVERFEETNAKYGNLESRVNLGALYHLAGDSTNRDRVLARTTELIQHGIDNGWKSWVADYYLAAVAAAKGNMDSAIPHLGALREKGFRSSYMFDNDFLWGSYRSDPNFQAMVDQIKVSNAEVLETISRVDLGT